MVPGPLAGNVPANDAAVCPTDRELGVMSICEISKMRDE